jgi:hypothetical protein
LQHGNITGIKLRNLKTDSVLFNLSDSTHQAFMNNIPPELEKTLYEGLHFDLVWPRPTSLDDQYRGITVIKRDERGRTTRDWQRWATNSESNLYAYTIQLRSEGYPLPMDVEFRVENKPNADTSWSQTPQFIPIYPLNFTTWNVTDPYNPKRMKVKVLYDISKQVADKTPQMYGQIWDSTRIVLLFGPHMEKGKLNYYSGWEIRFFKDIHDSLRPAIPPKAGDIFRFRTYRGPNRNDVYRFTVEGGEFKKELAKDRMKDIYVVPDPYVVSSTFESMYNIGERSARKIEFVNLPPQCTIKIFTASGKHVRTLEHTASVDYGRRSWDLTTEDGPEVAFGIYFYYVDAPGIGKKTGKFAIIK